MKFFFLILHNAELVRGVAQPGSALAWGARGREFESRRPDHEIPGKRDVNSRLFFFTHWRQGRLGISNFVVRIGEKREIVLFLSKKRDL